MTSIAAFAPYEPYFAFVSGSLAYDCVPCTRCCRGMGISDDDAHVSGSAALARMGAFACERAEEDPLVSFFNYADGCRFLASDHACELHRTSGAEAKPLICRLFPFSRMVEVEGLRVILPNGSCPFVPAPARRPSPLSEHAPLRQLLADALLARLTPRPIVPTTWIGRKPRRKLETTLRDELDLQAAFADVVAAQAARQAALAGPVLPLPSLDLSLDLLRTAGEPKALSPANERLLVACVPVLRVLLADVVPLAAYPAALAAFGLWLRALCGELGSRALGGDDLLHLFTAARPLLHLLALAEQPIAKLPPCPDHASEELAGIWEGLRAATGDPLGESLLRLLSSTRTGSVNVLFATGEALLATTTDGQ